MAQKHVFFEGKGVKMKKITIFDKKLRKILWVQKKVLPLHSQLRNDIATTKRHWDMV